MLDLLKKKGVKKPSYVDIGAHHPIFGNNTYLFYRAGGSGALVEPNPEMCRLAKSKRSRDTCLNAGAGAHDGEADFYMFSQSTRSTFSKEQAQAWEASSGQKASIEKRSILSLDSIIQKGSAGKAPDIISIDAEGLDAEILSGFSFVVRPKLFCIESNDQVAKVMAEKGYELKAQILQNAIFMDTNI